MGAVTDQLSEMLRGDFPIQLVIGWAVWAGGGLLLMLWSGGAAGLGHRATPRHRQPFGCPARTP